jgi:hypothetical protein
LAVAGGAGTPSRSPQDAASDLERLRGLPAETSPIERAALVRSAALRAGPATAATACAVLREELERACREIASSDPQVRGQLIALLRSPKLGLAERAARAECLEQVVLRDPQAELRREAVDALVALDDGCAAQALERLLARTAGAEQALVARARSQHPRERAGLLALVQGAFDAAERAAAGSSPLSSQSLAELLGVGYGYALAEAPGGGRSARDLLPLILGRAHPAEEVRQASAQALEVYLARAQFLGGTELAIQTLEGLVGQGLEDGELLQKRARTALEAQLDPAFAEACAKDLETLAAREAGPLARRRLSAALLYQAMARLAQGRGAELDRGAEGQASLLERTAELLDDLLAERWELEPHRAPAVQVDLLERRAQLELLGILAALERSGLAPARERDLPAELGAAIRERALAAHRWSLEAQRAALAPQIGANALPAISSLGELFGGRFSPLVLVLARRGGAGAAGPSAGLSSERAQELALCLGRALAGVAPSELPGFEPWPAAAPPALAPHLDPTRRALLEQIQEREIQLLERRIDELQQKLARAQPQELGAGDLPRSLEVSRALQQDLETLRQWRGFLLMLQGDGDESVGSVRAPRGLSRLRSPSALALDLAGELRESGQSASARELIQRARDAVQAGAVDELWRTSADGTLFVARAEAALGSTWMDEDQPQRAEEVLEGALDRLEELRSELEQRGALERARAMLDGERASVLISLAVNANVKLGDPARALGYFERAWELRQDDFTRVLLACYRARAGRTAEARAVLADLPPSPSNSYNLACTWALLGERELALEHLRREFEGLRAGPGALERQRQWAARDPDLASLRGDPRFQALIAADSGAPLER